ncbi:MAG: hypothetical protein K0S86_4469, partial [Geminicoccaceae bacterium]|nr:hypothetical protein [Geminicoccaceae bacterium]
RDATACPDERRSPCRPASRGTLRGAGARPGVAVAQQDASGASDGPHAPRHRDRRARRHPGAGEPAPREVVDGAGANGWDVEDVGSAGLAATPRHRAGRCGASFARCGDRRGSIRHGECVRRSEVARTVVTFARPSVLREGFCVICEIYGHLRQVFPDSPVERTASTRMTSTLGDTEAGMANARRANAPQADEENRHRNRPR